MISLIWLYINNQSLNRNQLKKKPIEYIEVLVPKILKSGKWNKKKLY